MGWWAAGMVLLGLALAGTAGAASLGVDVNPATGAWTRFTVDGRNVALGAAGDVEVSAGPASLPRTQSSSAVGVERRPGRLSARRRSGAWLVQDDLRSAGRELRRRVTLTWEGADPARVTGVTLRTPPVRLGSAGARRPGPDWYLVPGNFPIRKRTWDRLSPGRSETEAGWTRGDYGLAVVHSPAARLSLIAAYRFEHDQARVAVDETGQGVALVHQFDTSILLQRGQSVTVGEQVLRCVPGPETALEAGVAALSDGLGNGPPADRPRGFEKTVLYELHPWGRLEAAGSGDRGMRFGRLQELLPWYRGLGVTALWMLPVSWPPPWVYMLPEFGRVAPELGTPEELKALVRSAHGSGIRVLADLVVYGIHPDSPEVARHPPDVWCRDHTGAPIRVWGDSVLAADTSSAAWQRRIREMCAAWARDYGFDGARLDCIGWGQTVNWGAGGRANDAVAYGGLQLNKVVREAFRAGSPAAFTLPEGGKPLVFRHADTVFDYPLYLAMRDMTATPDVKRWVADLREWLEWERLCYPRAALGGLVRFLENHDTVPSAEYFGVGPAQALMAVCCLIQGTPLVYQEQETGYSRELAAWLRLRNAEPAFHSGTADYRSARASDGRVLAFMRRHGARRAIVAVNMTGAAVACTLTWPGGKARVRVPAYRPVVLLVLPGKAPRHLLAAPAQDLAPGSWRIRTAEGTLRDVFAPMAARVRPGEALTDALPVLRRAWNPLAGGLLDGAPDSELEVRRPDGTRQAVSLNPGAASEARIDDPACDGRAARVVVEPEAARGARAPAGRPDIAVTAQFVQLTRGGSALTLARRHGGLPVDWRAGPGLPSILEAGGDFYSDQGLFEGRTYGSADGETNPRLQTAADAPGAALRGAMRGRAWNGVATCHPLGPATAYAMGWRLLDGGRAEVALSVTPSGARPAGAGFVALRLPLAGVRAWQRGRERGVAGPGAGDRLGSLRGAGGEPLVVETAAGTLTVEPAAGLANTFLIDHGGGRVSLFVCLLDGASPALPAGQPIAATVTLRLQGPAPRPRA